MITITIAIWLACSIGIAIAANNRGRSGVLWLLIAVVTSPLLAGVLLLAMGRAARPGDDVLDRVRRNT